MTFSDKAAITGVGETDYVKGTERTAVDGTFKTPTLRNVELTAPYFHNASFATLEDVVSFYATRESDPARWYPVVNGQVQRYNDLPAALRTNVHQGAPFRRAGQLPAALDHYRSALDLVERVFAQTQGLDEATRENFIGRFAPYYVECLDLLLRLEEGGPPGRKEELGTRLAEMLGRGRGVRAAGSDHARGFGAQEDR